MAVYFRDFDKTRDWRTIVEELALAGPDFISLNPLGIYKAIKSAVTESNPEPGTDERAGIWLRVTAATALFDLLNDHSLGIQLNTGEKKKAAKTFLAEALSLTGFDEFTDAIAANPAAAPPVAEIIKKLPEFIRHAAPGHPFTDNALRARFADKLRDTSARVIARDPDFYAHLDHYLDSHLAEGHRRNRAWARHANWIGRLFHETRIFDDDLTLASAYFKLRCFWHTTETDEKGKPIRVAHIAGLHETAHAWLLDEKANPLRVVVGSPGSGKSSFSRAFANEVIALGSHRVLHIRLRHMPFSENLREAIGEHLYRRYHETNPDGAEGFKSNPLNWLKVESQPCLLIFDGLDELTHEETEARRLASKFLKSLKEFLRGPETVRALVLGRPEPAQHACEAIGLGSHAFLHVMPLAKPTKEILIHPDKIVDPEKLGDWDQRNDFWVCWATRKGLPTNNPPEGITADNMGHLNAEPLLLHLLNVSGYLGSKWPEAADNPNRVFEAIFTRIFERDKGDEREHPGSAEISTKADFLMLLECLGLAIWPRQSLTCSVEEYSTKRDLFLTETDATHLSEIPPVKLESLATLFFARQDTESTGFELVHRSFGDYLTARALISLGLQAASTQSIGDEELALRWVKLVGNSELTDEVINFAIAEADLRKSDQVQEARARLTSLFNWCLKNGMPANRAMPTARYRDVETIQRCSESALLAVVDTFNRAVRTEEFRFNKTPRAITLDVDWKQNDCSPREFIERLKIGSGKSVRCSVGCLPFARSVLNATNLSGANLSGSDFRGSSLFFASLNKTNFDHACLDDARLHSARLSDVSMRRVLARRVHLDGSYMHGADLSGGNFFRARLVRADIRDARLDGINLQRASLHKVCLEGSSLEGANLMYANFRDAELGAIHWRHVKLQHADFTGADLCAADFNGVDLFGVKLNRASLIYVKLTNATNVDEAALSTAFGVKSGPSRTQLPSGIEPPSHWFDPYEEAHRGKDIFKAYLPAYRRWLTNFDPF